MLGIAPKTLNRRQIKNVLSKKQNLNIKNVRSKSRLSNFKNNIKTYTYFSIENLLKLMHGHRQIKFEWQEQPIREEDKSSNFELLKDNTFIFNGAYNDAIAKLQYTNFFQFQIGNITIFLYISHSYKKREHLNKFMQELVLILKKFFMINSYVLSEKKILYISLFDLPYRITLTDELSPENLNSGVTIYYPNNPEIKRIIIYRKFKMIKVLLHELIHAFDIQLFNSSFVNDLEYFLNTNFNVITKGNDNVKSIKVNEIIAEFLAIYFQLIIMNNNKPPKVIHSLIKKEFKKYITFSNTILNSQRISSILQLYRRSNEYNPNVYLQQSTNAFSYYIMTALFLKVYQYILYQESHDLVVFITLLFGG